MTLREILWLVALLAVNFAFAKLVVYCVKRWERRYWERLRKELPK